MKKAPALITIAIILSAAALIIFLYGRNGKTEINAWQLIPSGAIGVLETNKPATLQRLQVDTAGLIDLISALGRPRKLADPYLFCFQTTGKHIEWVAILPKGFPSPLDTLNALRKSLNQRSYAGKSLYDVRQGNATWATFANVSGTWVISRNSLLVEEIVRQSQHPERNFKESNAALFSLSTVRQDDGNLYVNWSAASSFINRGQGGTPDLSHSIVLDLKSNDLGLQGNGFAVDTTTYSTLLSTFTGQKPVTFELRKDIPDQFTRAAHFGFSNPQLWFTSRDKVYVAHDTTGRSLSSMEKAFGFSMDEFAKAIDDEMMYCEFDDEGEVIVIELKEITRAQTQLDKIRRAVDSERESYADRTIITLKKEGVLAPIVVPFDLSSPQTSYAVDDNLLVLSPRREWVKRFIDFRDREQTLGKSITWSKFLGSTLGESNVSLIINNSTGQTPGSSVGLPSLALVDKASLQFYALRGNYYSSALIQFADNKPGKPAPVQPSIVTMKLPDKLLRGPWLVRNHAEKQDEVLLQDAALRLVFLDRSGKVRWTKDVSAEISTGIQEIDYFKNGKLQYLFCTPGELHIIDRLGNYVKGFPRKVDMKAPQWLSVVDYDKNRNYRIVLADKEGKILLVDKNGKALEGWQQKTLGRAFADAPTHYRIAQKDYFVAVTTDGHVHLFNRKGDTAKPFPLNTGFAPSGEIFCDGSLISLVSEDGNLIKLNSNGRREFEEPILKNVTTAKFKLTAASDRSDFIIVRLERGNLAIFDSSAKLKFEIVNPLSDNVEVQYYRRSNQSQIIVVRDVVQGLLYVLDGSGTMLTGAPVPVPHAPAADLGEDSIARLFFINDDTLAVLELAVR